MHKMHGILAQLNLQHLHTFQLLARIQNFSRVGEQIGLSQSAVSRHIRALECSLGLRLFDRIGRRVVLTPEGKVLRSRLEALVREADALPGLLQDLSEGVKGDLGIGACITAANAFLPTVLGRYRKKYPSVVLRFQPLSTEDSIESLRRGEIDLAFVASDRLPTSITTLAEIPDELVLISGPKRKHALHRMLQPGELSAREFIQREDSSDTRALLMRWLESEDVAVRNVMDVW